MGTAGATGVEFFLNFTNDVELTIPAVDDAPAARPDDRLYRRYIEHDCSTGWVDGI